MSDKKNSTTGFLRKNIKKADIILLIILVCAGLAMTWFSTAASSGGRKAVVSVDGKVYGTYDLSKNRTVTVRQNGHKNKIVIKNGKVQMAYSTCRNQVCVEHSAISRTNQQIVCLPNRVMIRIEGKDSNEDIDAYSNP